MAEANYELQAVAPDGERRVTRKRGSGKTWRWGIVLAKMTKLFKAMKLIKIVASFGSMIISVFAYSFAMGLPFAIGFVVLLFCHEVGHVIALRHKGIKASLPVFIPFLGAAVFAPKFGDRHDEAYMAFAGPLIGSACAFVLFVAALVAPGSHSLLLGIAFTALIINLFNLIPISPLDGGRVTQAVGPMFKYVGFAALLAITIALQTPGLLVIWVVVLSDMHIKHGLRFALGLLLEALAIIMMSAGIGTDQSFWINVIDVVLMSFMNTLFGAYVFSRDHSDEVKSLEQKDNRPQLPKQQRIRWFAAYAVLAAMLIAGMFFMNAQFTAMVA